MIHSFKHSLIGSRPILLLGAGIYGEIAYFVITKLYRASISAVFDNKCLNVPWTNQLVMRTAEMKKYKDADVIICAANAFDTLCEEGQKHQEQGIKIYDMKEILEDYLEYITKHPDELKSTNLYGDIDVQDIVERYCFFADGGEKNSYYQNKITLPYFVLSITSKCSLRCKYCGALCTKYNPQRDYSFDSLKGPMEVLLEAIDGITELELMGGEPFLHSEFNTVLSWCIAQKKIRAVKIVTNGTIVPQDDTWNILRHNKVKLVIDDYGSLSRNLGRLVELSEEYNVRYEVLKLSTWYQYVDPIVKKNMSQDNLKEIFLSCLLKNCTGILDGKLYRCLFAGQMDVLNLSSNIENDYIQISGVDWDPNELRSEIRSLLNVQYLKSCDYCNYCNATEIKVAEQEEA